MSSTHGAAAASIMGNVVPLQGARVDDLADDFHALFVETFPRVVRTVWFVVHDQQVAEEVAQDAFTELYRVWRRVRDYDQPALWVRRVALRKAQREAARAVRRARLERQASLLRPVEDHADSRDDRLTQALRSLPPRQRAVVALYYLEDRPMDEVADLVGCSPATGYVHLHQARVRLAAALGARHADPLVEEVDGDVR
ncbi:MAG TPA: sigma-70 family RNA polymerase sigma factor [Nocardioides sp.]|nr:sigma-70 family RNA polymerase sigma factor [Nocardioides sp.]